jgi:hypothetical protein
MDELEVEMELIYELVVDDSEDDLEDAWFQSSAEQIASIEDAPRRQATLGGRVLRLIGWRETDAIAA